MKVVRVTSDAKTGRLLVDPPDLDLEKEESVVWIFVGIPNDLLPTIDFLVETGDNLGPFASLRTTPFQVIAQGRKTAGHFSYTAGWIDAEQRQHARSDLLSITTATTVADTAPTVDVRLLREDRLVVEPELFGIFNGDVVLWRFEEFPGTNWFPRIVFHEAPANLVNAGLGPFESLTRHAKTIVGSGNNGVTGLYRYWVEIVDTETRRVLHRHDPALANNGDPPGG